MAEAPRGLAELHCHYGGALRSAQVLDHLLHRRTPREWWRFRYRQVYGADPPLEDLLRRHRNGDASAAADFARLHVFAEADAGAFDRFAVKYQLVDAASARGDGDSFHRVTGALRRELASDIAHIASECRRQGIGWCEVRMGTSLKRRESVRRQLWLQGLTWCRDASDADLQLRAVISLPREAPLAAWPLVQELATGPLGWWLVGVDFCQNEAGYPPAHFADFADSLRRFNADHPERALAWLHHVGEQFDHLSLASAVRWCQEAAELGAHRLGHAIALGIDAGHFAPHERSEAVRERRAQIAYDLRHAADLTAAGVAVDAQALRHEQARLATRADDDAVTIEHDAARLAEWPARQAVAMRAVRAAGAVVESCPSSNRRVAGIADRHHPVHRFHAAGLPFVIASDDPGLLDIDLGDEIDWAVRQLGLDEAGRSALIERAWAARSPMLAGRPRP